MSSQTKESRLREILSLSECLQHKDRIGGKEIDEISETMFTESEDFGAAVIHHVRTSSICPSENYSNYYLMVADLTPGLKIVSHSSAGLIENRCKNIKILMLKKEGDAVIIKYNNGEVEKIRKFKIKIETVHKIELI
jgi:hypothetical protein